MPILIIVDDPQEWPSQIPNVEVVAAWSYLTQPAYSDLRNVKLFNLCSSYKYQSTGYYVSLLAEARGHKPQPSITTIQDLKSQAFVRLVDDDLEDVIQKSLDSIQSDKFTLSIYFGRNLASKHSALSLQLYNLFQSPLLRAQFVRNGQRKWHLRSMAAISADEVPEGHWPFVIESASEHFAGKRTARRRRPRGRYDLAILYNPEEKSSAPSDEKALKKFIKAAESLGVEAELITRDDYARLAEFDALFIRETTFVNHHTYRFARRAASEGLVVIDDPQTIVRCSNKVYLAELMNRHEIPTPKTLVIHKDNVDLIASELGFPCVLKKPDSAFSIGVVKVESPEKLNEELARFFEGSELVVAQQFVPSDFDWRIGIIDRRPLYACKYFMVTGHWQIMKYDRDKTDYGRYETLPVELAPRKAVSIALKAANLIGDGFYGVDVKQHGNDFQVMEVNDNPSIDSGVEDQVLRDELYRRVMQVFLTRIEQRKAGMVTV